MTINGIEYKQFDENYYVSEQGDVYSKYSGKCLKHYIDHDGYHRVDLHGSHMKVHKLVYLSWCGSIPHGLQINHKDDNKDNNHYKNLYLGTQTENISDCARNKHRCGNVMGITVLDKYSGTIESYPTIREFLDSTGHSNKSGSLAKVKNKKWFMEKYDILSLERCRDYRKLAEAKASRVVRSLSPHEAQGAVN